MTASGTFEDPTAIDKPMCARFGSGVFPCGPAFKVLVATQSRGPGRGNVTRRTTLCEAHYVFHVTKTSVSGGASGLKSRAKSEASLRLAAAHQDEFQRLYEQALTNLCEQAVPPIDPALLMPHLAIEVS